VDKTQHNTNKETSFLPAIVLSFKKNYYSNEKKRVEEERK